MGVATSATHAHAWLFAALVPVGLVGALLAKGLSPSVEAAGWGVEQELSDGGARVWDPRARSYAALPCFSPWMRRVVVS